MRPGTVAAWGLVLASGLAFFSTSARGQAVAFAPVIGTVPDGVLMDVTPVVSPDRRYVRLSVNVGFFGLQGFDTVVVPAAVAGGGGPGALGAGGRLPGFALSTGSPFDPNHLVPGNAVVAAVAPPGPGAGLGAGFRSLPTGRAKMTPRPRRKATIASLRD